MCRPAPVGRAWLLAGLLGATTLVAGCQREPDFDERYEAASQKIQKSAREIDARVHATSAPEAVPKR